MPTLLQTLKPAFFLIPEVEPVRRYISKIEKIIWTGITLFIYLICCQVPLYGVQRAKGSDPFYWMRVILASNRGTLMELGISPQITSSMIMQFLTGISLIKVDKNVEEDRILYGQAQKFLGILISICEGIAYIWSNAYGNIDELGFGNALIILFQLTFSGIVVLLLDDLLNKGYGIGSGISLFIATNVCENIIWKSLSPITITSQSGVEFEGSIINLIHQLFTKPKFDALNNAFNRQSAPNITNLLATFLVFFVVIYFQGFKVDIHLINQKYRGKQMIYPIKLFYVSSTPVILQSALVSNLYFFSQIIWKKYRGNFLVRIIGQWQELDFGGQSIPIGGIAYYISPPREFSDFLRDPIHFIVYIVFVSACCGLFSRFWILLSGEGPLDVAKKLKDQHFTILGNRQDSLTKVFSKYIPIAAVSGGICIGLLSVLADLLGAIGSGTGILLAITIIYGYFEILKKDKDRKNQQIEYFDV